jgi:hypothetical protein
LLLPSSLIQLALLKLHCCKVGRITHIIRLTSAFYKRNSRHTLQHYQPQACASGDGIGATPGAEFGEDGGDVEFDGVLADGEVAGDEFVGQALC